MRKRVLLCLTAIAFAAGCSKQPEELPPPARTSPARTDTPASPSLTHAPAGVVPGSHEDWCEEHQVPESVCTRCDPSLIPAFKATNDWCDEHGLPESQCLACKPDLEIIRPPKPEGA